MEKGLSKPNSAIAAGILGRTPAGIVRSDPLTLVSKGEVIISLGSKVLETACDLTRDASVRSTLRAESGCRTTAHEQFMQKLDYLDRYGTTHYDDMADEEKRAYHQAVLCHFSRG